MESLMTVNAVAERLSVSRETIYRWCREGRLTGIRIGDRWRFTPEEIARFIASGSVETK